MKEIITVRGLSKSFNGGEKKVTALNGVDLTVYEGDIFGVIGLSGAGKSTLVRCLNRLEEPDEGSIIINGQDIRSLNEKELNVARRNIGMIFQQFNLLSQASILENVCFPMEIAHWKKADAKKRALELIELVGLSGRESAYPSQLSGGMKQRVAIARALTLSPKILLCDEATSALDPATTRSILALLKKINKELGVTIVIITHQMSVIEEACNRVSILDKSRIVECGDVEDVFHHPKSDIARQLILGEGAGHTEFTPGGKRVRIVFDGKDAFEPIIADIVLNCKAAVNILFADTRTIDGVVYGQMLVQLPDDEDAAQRILTYLSGTGVHFSEEEDGNV
jgi:D-methionine transport system ATP-binding protein